MKEMPWQDIFTDDQWAALISQYQSGLIESRSTTWGSRFKSKLGFEIPLLSKLDQLDRQVRYYNSIPKQSVETLRLRAGTLRLIAATGAGFLASHRIPTKDEQKASLDKDAYKEYKRTLDYAVSKLTRRATRKAAYIETLARHIDDEHIGFANTVDLLEYLKSKAGSPVDEELVRLQPGEYMERVDPWHRDFQLSFNEKATNPRQGLKGGASVVGNAFYQWTQDTTCGDIPFFVWLEGHFACTGHFAYPRTRQFLSNLAGEPELDGRKNPSGHIHYQRSDLGLSGKMPLISPNSDNGRFELAVSWISARNGILRAYSVEGDKLVSEIYSTKMSEEDVMAFPDALPQSKGRGRMEAYVWSRDQVIFAAPHVQAQLHHSTFVSGRKVRCAGMIETKGGKVTQVDNDSGHYKPDTRHLRNFIQFLRNANVLDPKATMRDVSVKPETRLTCTEFLRGDRHVRIVRALKALRVGATDLRSLVEDRFREMKSSIGPAPEHLLWERAYRSVCLEFGEVESKWKTKADAPPIPREKAPPKPKKAPEPV